MVTTHNGIWVQLTYNFLYIVKCTLGSFYKKKIKKKLFTLDSSIEFKHMIALMNNVYIMLSFSRKIEKNKVVFKFN